MWNLALLIPEPERFTRVYRGQGELIDHLLVSHALIGAVSEVTTGEWTCPPSGTTRTGVWTRRDLITGPSWRPSTSDHVDLVIEGGLWLNLIGIVSITLVTMTLLIMGLRVVGLLDDQVQGVD